MPTPGEPLAPIDRRRADLLIRLVYLEDHRGHVDEVAAIRRELRELRNLDHP